MQRALVFAFLALAPFLAYAALDAAEATALRELCETGLQSTGWDCPKAPFACTTATFTGVTCTADLMHIDTISYPWVNTSAPLPIPPYYLLFISKYIILHFIRRLARSGGFALLMGTVRADPSRPSSASMLNLIISIYCNLLFCNERRRLGALGALISMEILRFLLHSSSVFRLPDFTALLILIY